VALYLLGSYVCQKKKKNIEKIPSYLLSTKSRSWARWHPTFCLSACYCVLFPQKQTWIFFPITNQKFIPLLKKCSIIQDKMSVYVSICQYILWLWLNLILLRVVPSSEKKTENRGKYQTSSVSWLLYHSVYMNQHKRWCSYGCQYAAWENSGRVIWNRNVHMCSVVSTVDWFCELRIRGCAVQPMLATWIAALTTHFYVLLVPASAIRAGYSCKEHSWKFRALHSHTRRPYVHKHRLFP
jgi:hypothetical protein